MPHKIISSSNQGLNYIGTFLSGAVNDGSFQSIQSIFADPNNPNNWTATEIENAINLISSTSTFLDGTSNAGFVPDAKNFLVGTIYNALITRLQQLKGEIITIHDPLLKYTLNAYVRGATSNTLYYSLINNNQGNIPESSVNWKAVEKPSYYPIRVILSNNILDLNNDIDFSAGYIMQPDGTQWSSPAITKRLDANWVVGTNQGGLDTGTKAINTQYHCYAIYNPTTQVSDIIFSINTSTPILPVGFTKFQYLNTIITNANNNIIAFTQIGRRTELALSIATHQNVSQTVNTETLRTISSAGVPLGRNVRAFGTAKHYVIGNSSEAYFKVYSASKTISTLNAFDGGSMTTALTSTPITGAQNWQAVTNTSAQIKTNSIYLSLSSVYISVDGYEFLD